MQAQPGYVKSLQILHNALLIGLLLFALIVILLVKNGFAATGNNFPADIFLYIAIAMSVILVAMSYKLFNQKLEEAKQENNLEDKLNGYRAAFILQLALCEAPGLFAIICYFLTGNKMLLGLLFLLVVNFGSSHLTKSKLVQQLELDDEEASMLD
ncbi:MAG TPA: hypothetical protein VIH86_14130 [Puia sp.]|jgi:hypothetical protein